MHINLLKRKKNFIKIKNMDRICECGITYFYDAQIRSESAFPLCFVCWPLYKMDTDKLRCAKNIQLIFKKELFNLAAADLNLEFIMNYSILVHDIGLLDDFKKLPMNIYEYFVNLIKIVGSFKSEYNGKLHNEIRIIKEKAILCVSRMKKLFENNDLKNSELEATNLSNEIKKINEFPSYTNFKEKYSNYMNPYTSEMLFKTIKSLVDQLKLSLKYPIYKWSPLQKMWQIEIEKVENKDKNALCRLYANSLFDLNKKIEISEINLRRFGIEVVGITDLYIFGGMKIKTDKREIANLSKKTYCYNLLKAESSPKPNLIYKNEMKIPTFSIKSCVVGNSLIFSIGLMRKSQDSETTSEMYDIRNDRWSIQKSPTHHTNIFYLVALDNRYIYAICASKSIAILDTNNIEQEWNNIEIDIDLMGVHFALQVSQHEIMIFTWEENVPCIFDIRSRKFRGPSFCGPNFTQYLAAGGNFMPYIHSTSYPIMHFLSYKNIMEAEKISDTPCYISNHSLSRSDIDIESNVEEFDTFDNKNVIFNIPPEVKYQTEHLNNEEEKSLVIKPHANLMKKEEDFERNKKEDEMSDYNSNKNNDPHK